MELYENPSNAENKGDVGAKLRRNKADEIQLFVPFQQLEMPEQQINPFKIQRVKSKNRKIVKAHKVPNKQAGFDPLDPMNVANAKQYNLVHQKDKTNSPR